jgi:hypothetical protein
MDSRVLKYEFEALRFLACLSCIYLHHFGLACI